MRNLPKTNSPDFLVGGAGVSAEDALAQAWATGDFAGLDPVTVTALTQGRHSPGTLSMSTIFGGMLHRAWLEAHHPAPIQPKRGWYALRGVWLHKGFESVPVPDGVEVIRERTFSVVVNGLEVRGTPDLFIPSLGILYDLKTVGAIPDKPHARHVGQLSGYKWLLEQHGYSVQEGYIIYVSFDAYRKMQADFWPQEDVIQAIEEAVVIWQDDAPPGRAFCNTAFCRTCPVFRTCWSQALGAKSQPPRGKTSYGKTTVGQPNLGQG